MPNFSLEGKVAIITGASRGIGESVAHTYAQAGAKVVLVSRKLDGVTAVAEAIRQAGVMHCPSPLIWATKSRSWRWSSRL